MSADKYKTELLDEEEGRKRVDKKETTKLSGTALFRSLKKETSPSKNKKENTTANTTISQFFKPKEGNERSAVLKHLLSDDFKEDADFQVDNSPLKKFKLPSQLDMEGADPLILSEEPLVKVPGSINKKLRDYQREGIKFLYNLYKGKLTWCQTNLVI